MEEKATKRKRAPRAKKSTEEDSSEKVVTTKRRRGVAAAPKLPWVDCRDWMEPWCFQEEIFINYKSNFPEEEAEIDLSLDLIKHQDWMNLLKEPTLTSKTQASNLHKFFKANEPSVPKTTSVSSQFHWGGEDITVSMRDLARSFGLETGSHLFRIF